MSRIYWDTMLFVYLVEAHPQFTPRVRAIHQRIQERGDTICTSVLAVGELLVGPHKVGAAEVVAHIGEAFRNPLYRVQSFTWEIAELYAKIRAADRVSPPDAVHLATAATVGVDLFLTNDRRLAKLVIPGIDFIAGLDVNLF
ncbi:MAG TPA: PIN domain-containing protein [Candidatus Solibacter sp.]|nr:PIN domain-containing protein [Candidatus Solibacter sp.]